MSSAVPSLKLSTSSIDGPREAQPAGVGIYLQEDGGDIVVSHLIRGGSGDRSGTVKPGDIIVGIDGEDWTNRGLSVMRNSLVGPEGSSVEVGFRRLTEGGQGYMSYSVLLMRGTPDYLQQLLGDVPADPDFGVSPGTTPRGLTPRGFAAESASSKTGLSIGLQPSSSTQRNALEEELLMLKDQAKGFQEALRTEIGRRRQEERLRHEVEEKLERIQSGQELPNSKRLEDLEAMLQEERKARLAAERRLAADPTSTSDIDRLHETIATLSEKLADAESSLAQEKASLHRVTTAYASLQAANAHKQHPQAPPVSLDQQFKDIARMSIIAIPHLVHHLKTLIESPSKLKGSIPSSMVMMQTLEPTRIAAITTIPQSIAHLTSLLQSKQAATVREASFALALTTSTPEGREAILSVKNAVAQIEVLLGCEDNQAVRHAVLAIGNVAMEHEGRRMLMTVFSVVDDLVQLVSSKDLDCARGAALALGNLVVEEDARGRFLQIPMSVRSLAERLKSVDHLLVRYTTGALRNIGAEEKGRRAILAQQDAVAALKGLLSSPDGATAQFAESALKNLSITPFSRTSGNMNPRDLSRVQKPYRADKPNILGMELPFSDGDGLGIPQFRQKSYDSSSITL